MSDFQSDEQESFAVGIKRFPYHYHMRRLREERGWTQGELAAQAGVAVNAVRMVETLKEVPSERLAEAIADVLDVDTRWLFPEWSASVVGAISTAPREGVMMVTPQMLNSPEIMRLDSGERLEDKANESLNAEQVRKFLLVLSPKERKIISMRFGLDDGVPRNLEEVGIEFGLTRERIRQLEAKALKRLERSRAAIRARALLGSELTPAELEKKELEHDFKIYRSLKAQRKVEVPFKEWREEYLSAELNK